MAVSVRLILTLLAMSVFVVYVSGCAGPAHPGTAQMDIPDSFSVTGTGSTPEKWWQAFGDDSLNEVIESALSQNLDILAAWDRLAQAEAVIQQVDSRSWPSLNLSAGGARSRQEISDMTFYNTNYSLGLGAGYEVDLWSQVKASRQIARLNADARQEAVYTMAITISASIADTWYRLAESKALEKIIRRQIETNEKVLQIVTIQFRNGMTSAADVLRQRQLIAATQAQHIAVEEVIQLLQNRLSVLIGKAPSAAWKDTDIEFPTVQDLPDLGVPTEVLWRRPDIRQMFRYVQVADRSLAVAIADQYPRLSLSGSVSSSAPSIRDLFDDWAANLAANAMQPLFDAGQRKARVKQQKAYVSETLHTWKQSMLDAIKEIEDVLVQEQQQKRILKNLQYQLGLAQQTFEQNRQRYIKGQTDYIRVLESLQSLQSLERNVISAEIAVIQSRIALYRSTAGKWDIPQPEIEKLPGPEQTVSADINPEQDSKEPL